MKELDRRKFLKLAVGLSGAAAFEYLSPKTTVAQEVEEGYVRNIITLDSNGQNYGKLIIDNKLDDPEKDGVPYC